MRSNRTSDSPNRRRRLPRANRTLVEPLETRTLLSGTIVGAMPDASASALLASAPQAMTLPLSNAGLPAVASGLRRFRIAPVIAAANAASVPLPLPRAAEPATAYWLDMIRGLTLNAGPSVLTLPTGPGNPAPTIDQPATAATSTIAGTSVDLSVRGADDAGESNLTYTWALASAPSGAAADFSANGTNAAKNTTVTFHQAGHYALQVTVSDGESMVFSTVGVLVSQTFTSLTLHPAQTSAGLNSTMTITAAALDQFGLPMDPAPALTWSTDLGTINAGAFNTGTTPGTATISATDGTLSASTRVAIANQAPVLVTPAAVAATSSTVLHLSALATDDGGASGLRYTWTVLTAPTSAHPNLSVNGVAAAHDTDVTLDYAGSYSFRVTITDGTFSVTGTVSATVAQTLTSLVVTPGTVNVPIGTSEQFSAAFADQFGQAMTGPAVTWSVPMDSAGSISPGGLYTATDVGPATVQASADGLVGSAAVTVTAGAPAAVTTRTLYSFIELDITGTSGNDSITISQSGNNITVYSNGQSQSVSGTYGDIVIHGGDGNDTITVDSSIRINTLLYGDAGNNTLTDHGAGSYNALIAIGGGADTLTGNGTTVFWADTSDTVNATTNESANGYVHQISAFYQPWTNDPNNPDYVNMSLSGQDLRDPSASGSWTHLANRSLFGAGPVMADVNQGQAGDCYYVAALEGFAQGEPWRLTQNAVDLGDGTYAVSLKIGGVWKTVRVDGDLPGSGSYLSYAKTGATGDLWAPIYEKAYAILRRGQNSYSSLDLGGVTEGAAAFGVSVSSYYYNLDDLTLYNDMVSLLAAGREVLIGTGATIYGGAPLIGSHAYALVSASLDGSGKLSLTFRNPWGFDGTGNDGNTADALVTLSSDQLRANALFLYGATS